MKSTTSRGLRFAVGQDQHGGSGAGDDGGVPRPPQRARSVPRWAAWPRRGSSGAGSPRCRAAGIPGSCVSAWISRAARPEFMAAAWWPHRGGQQRPGGFGGQFEVRHGDHGDDRGGDRRRTCCCTGHCPATTAPVRRKSRVRRCPGGLPSRLVSCRTQSLPRAGRLRNQGIGGGHGRHHGAGRGAQAAAVRVDVVRRDPQAFVPEAQPVQRLGDGLDHQVARIAGQGFRTLSR